MVLEKPIALSVEDAEKIKAVSDAQEYVCVMQNRFAPPSQWLKGVVDSGDLGQIRQVHIQCFGIGMIDTTQTAWRGSLDLDGGPLFTNSPTS